MSADDTSWFEADDATLLAAAITSTDAFGHFYTRNQQYIFQYFASRMVSRHTAADLTADTFAEAMRTVDRFRPDRGEPRAWLFGIANNMLKRLARTATTSARALHRVGTIPDSGDHAQIVVDSVHGASLRPLVRIALERLTPPLRSAVLLRVVDQLPYAEVAARLGCSEGAARVRVNRGLRALAENRGLLDAWAQAEMK